MMNIRKQKGFTLVELAIVLVIIGLLIGGILKGQKLLLNAKVTATVAQIKGIEAAVTNFRDVYGALPGDLKNSYVKIPGCSALTSASGHTADDTYCETNGDGSVGESNWDMNTFQAIGMVGGTCSATGASCTYPSETLLLWYSLQQAGLISGVTSEIARTSGTVSHAFGKTVPAAKIGGGFWAGTSTNGFLGSASLSATTKYTLFGTIITLARNPGAVSGALLSTTGTFLQGTGVTTPAIAANIDRKLDDGLPATGSVQAYGYANNCFGGTTAASNAYKESSTTLDCGVHIRVQK